MPSSTQRSGISADEPWDGTFVPDGGSSEAQLDGGPGSTTRPPAPPSHGRPGRRVLLGLGAMGAGALLVSRMGDPPVPPPRTPPSPVPGPSGPTGYPTGPGDALPGTIDGVPMDWLPTADEVASLPLYPDREALGLPERIGWSRRDRLPRWAARPDPDARVRAVLVRALDEQRGRLVLYLPGAADEYVEIGTTLVLHDERGSYLPVADGIHPDRGRVAIIQPRGEIHVIDLRAGRTTVVEVPDRWLRDVGWTGTGDLVVSGSDHWRVRDGHGRRVTGDVWPAPERLVLDGDTPLHRKSYRGDGSTTGEQLYLPGPVEAVLGPTVTNLEGWSAAPVLVGPPPDGPSGRDYLATGGVYVVQVDQSPRPRILAMPIERDDGTSSQVEALAWAPRDHLLVAAPGGARTWVLAWDVISGSLSRVCEVVGLMSDERGPRRGDLFVVPTL